MSKQNGSRLYAISYGGGRGVVVEADNYDADVRPLVDGVSGATSKSVRTRQEGEAWIRQMGAGRPTVRRAGDGFEIGNLRVPTAEDAAALVRGAGLAVEPDAANDLKSLLDFLRGGATPEGPGSNEASDSRSDDA